MSAVVSEIRLPAGAQENRGTGWWGLLCAIATESALFAYLLFAYYYGAVQFGRQWVIGPLPEFRLSLPDTIVLLVSSGTAWFATHSVRQRRNGLAVMWLLITLVLGIAFVIVQLYEWKSKTFTLGTGSYASTYFTITGFHMAHVVVGLIGLVLATIWCARGYFSPQRDVPLAIVTAYWHFVDAVWLCVFFSIYITPRLWMS